MKNVWYQCHYVPRSLTLMNPQRFYRAAVVWKHLAHPNIIPLFGITTTPLRYISDWMSGGNLREYVEEYPWANRLRLVGGIPATPGGILLTAPQLSDVADGLKYLHSHNVLHRGLKGVRNLPNAYRAAVLTPSYGQSRILVDESGRARIGSFSTATVTQDRDPVQNILDEYTARWTAPEILNEQGPYSKEADIFSFAMVIIEVRYGQLIVHQVSIYPPSTSIQVFTGAVPFSGSPHPAAMLAIMDGKRPPRPTHPAFTNRLWALARRCWAQVPRSRPAASEVSRVLHSLLVSLSVQLSSNR